MHGGRTDASTSTDDVKGRPLCLFYFTHPFGVLSPEPPTVTTLGGAGPHVARAFLNMQPVACFRPPPSPSDDYDYDTTSSSRPSRPVRLVHNYPLDPGGDSLSLSSSLFSGGERRLVPYSRTLPPLRLPTPRDLAWDSSDDAWWPARCSTREKFSLPPIELSCSTSGASVGPGRLASPCGSRCRRAPAARHRRARLSGVQRMVTCLMKRTVKAGAMGYIFDYCPTAEACCYWVPLRPGVVCVAAAGLAWGALYCFLFSGEGARALGRAGMPAELGAGLRYVHGALGVLLLAVNALLLAAAAYESDSLCEVYLWFMVVFWAATLVAALAAVAGAASAGRLAFGAAYAGLALLALLLAGYFSVVVGNYRMTLP